MLLDQSVELRDGLFAYSMLYPLTDNWLDDPAVPSARKRAFNQRFGWRLAGLPVIPHDAREAAVFRLVARIEDELPRRDFPWVFESLLAIHEGQSRSLDQQGASGLGDDEILAISFEKGGSSVLADLHLVSPEAERGAGALRLRLRRLPAAPRRPPGRRGRPRGGARDALHASRTQGPARRAHGAARPLHRRDARRRLRAEPRSPSAWTSSAATAGRCSSAASPCSPRASRAGSGAGSRPGGRSRSAPTAGCAGVRSPLPERRGPCPREGRPLAARPAVRLRQRRSPPGSLTAPNGRNRLRAGCRAFPARSQQGVTP